MRALIVTSMYPSPDKPALGTFVHDQVQALRRTGEVELDVFSFPAGGARAWMRAAAELRRRHGGDRFDIVHAHFGLSLWPALAARGRARAVTLHGTDLAHPRSRAITLAGLRTLDLVAAASRYLSDRIPRWAASPDRVAVLPCGVELQRFGRIPRAEARAALGLDPTEPYLLFPSDPARAEKRFDLAQRAAGELPLLTLKGVEPGRVALWINAANAVLVPSDREGFGLAVLESLACDVPVLATPVGIHPEALAGVAGTLCAPFELERWRVAVEAHLDAEDPRVAGRSAAEAYSATAMAERVLAAWRRALAPAS